MPSQRNSLNPLTSSPKRFVKTFRIHNTPLNRTLIPKPIQISTMHSWNFHTSPLAIANRGGAISEPPVSFRPECSHLDIMPNTTIILTTTNIDWYTQHQWDWACSFGTSDISITLIFWVFKHYQCQYCIQRSCRYGTQTQKRDDFQYIIAFFPQKH